jgi:hypothetical protein
MQAQPDYQAGGGHLGRRYYPQPGEQPLGDDAGDGHDPERG